MIKHILNIILIVNISAAQDFPEDNEKNKVTEKGNKLFSNSKLLDNSNRIEKSSLERKNKAIQDLEFRFYIPNNTGKHSFDLISSVGSNISFGGFWEKYAVVNFTPQLYIKPAGFISIYANHYLNYLIPVGEITEYSRTIILQSLASLAVENSFKMLFNNNVNWIAEVVSFTAKNLLMNIFIKPAVSESRNSTSPILEYENFYYSIRFTF